MTAFSVGTAHERLNPLEQQQQYLDAPVIYAEFSDRAKMPVAQFGFANRTEMSRCSSTCRTPSSTAGATW